MDREACTPSALVTENATPPIDFDTDWSSSVSVAFDGVLRPSNHPLAISGALYGSVRITSPFYNYYSSGLVNKTIGQTEIFALFDPFTPGLWLALAL